MERLLEILCLRRGGSVELNPVEFERAKPRNHINRY
jgi:hypothetical protein